MKKLLSYSLILFCGIVSAQTITFEYTYDPAGNRIQREVILIEEQTPELVQKNAVLHTIKLVEEEMALRDQGVRADT